MQTVDCPSIAPMSVADAVACNSENHSDRTSASEELSDAGEVDFASEEWQYHFLLQVA